MTGDAATRRAALDQIRAVLVAGRDAAEVEAALSALWLAPAADVKDPEWTALAEQYVASGRAELRRAALLALAGTHGLRPVHLSAAAADPAAGVRTMLAGVLRRYYYQNRELGDRLFLRLLADPSEDVVEAAIEAAPANVGPGVQDRLAVLAQDRRWRNHAIPTMAMLVDKTPAVVAELSIALARSDGRTASAAARGLMEHVPPEARAEVADAALLRLERAESSIASECLQLLGRYGRETDIPRIERAVAAADSSTRSRAAAAIEAIRSRDAR